MWHDACSLPVSWAYYTVKSRNKERKKKNIENFYAISQRQTVEKEAWCPLQGLLYLHQKNREISVSLGLTYITSEFFSIDSSSCVMDLIAIIVSKYGSLCFNGASEQWCNTTQISLHTWQSQNLWVICSTAVRPIRWHHFVTERNGWNGKSSGGQEIRVVNTYPSLPKTGSSVWRKVKVLWCYEERHCQ